MEEDIREDILILEEIKPRLHRKYRNALEEVISQVLKASCTYEQADVEYNAWECSNCDEIWCLTEGNPKDNSMNYCPQCGARIVGFIEKMDEEE